MKMRKETIKKVSEFLNEDIENQFSVNEFTAAKEGKSYFYVENNKGDQVKVENIYSENVDVLDYAIISYKIKAERN